MQLCHDVVLANHLIDFCDIFCLIAQLNECDRKRPSFKKPRRNRHFVGKALCIAPPKAAIEGINKVNIHMSNVTYEEFVKADDFSDIAFISGSLGDRPVLGFGACV